MGKSNIFTFGLVIIVAAIIIAGGIFLSKQEVEIKIIEEKSFDRGIKINPITSRDHILGDPNADVVIVEYSDFGCPFCREFHPIITALMEDYGKSGRLAWVYRHFPLSTLDIDSEEIEVDNSVMTAECVADLAGEEHFWDFIDFVFTHSESIVPDEDLLDFVTNLEITEKDYNQCLESDKFDVKIKRDISDGFKIYEFDRNFGTPYNIIITKTGEQIEMVGAQSYEVFQKIIEQHSFPDSI